jgi:hypothetical protein
MQVPRLAFPASFLLLAPLFLAAQQAPQRDPSGVALLLEAAAPLSGGTPINDATLAATARRIAGSDNESGNATLKVTASGQSRLDFSFPSGRRSEVRGGSDDSPLGSWTGPDGVSHQVPLHNLLSDPAWFFPALLVVRAATKSDRAISYVGHETQDGVAVDHVTVYEQASEPWPEFATLLQRLTQLEIFLDAATHLPVAVTFDTHPDDDALTNIPIRVRYSDYRSVNGIAVPFHVQRFINNGLVLDLQVQTVNFNTGLSASDFRVQ